MISLEFLDDGIEEDFESGITLHEAIEECGADIIFGCREGGCATCIIRVKQGMEHLSPPSLAEQSTLEEDELADGLRLSCQITLTGEEGQVVIASAGL